MIGNVIISSSKPENDSSRAKFSWSQEKWIFDSWRLPTGVGYAQMVTHYVWESHLDAALPDGYSSHLPTPWLTQELNLYTDIAHPGVWSDQNDEVVFREFRGDEGGTVCLIRMDKAEEVAARDCTFLSGFISERCAWPGGSNSNAAWHRAEGVCWKNDRGMNVSTWSRDTRNNSSE
jgi:hypothetical protein